MHLPGLGAPLLAAFTLLYFAFIVFVVWSVISALNRISRGVEDISDTLRRMESNGNSNIR